MSKKGLIRVSINGKAKAYISSLAFVFISILCVGYVFYNKPNGVQVYLNGNPTCIVRNEGDFNKAQQEVKNDFEKRFGSIVFKDDIKFKKIRMNNNEFKDISYIKNCIIKNSNLRVNGVLMKCDGKKIGILANESEMRKVLDNVKESYIEKNKDSNLVLKNNITYVTVDSPISEIKSVDDAVKVSLGKEKGPLVVFDKQDKVVQTLAQAPSRAASKTAMMDVPSKGSITSEFGSRWGRMHNGIDIGASMGDNILSAMEGYVCYANWADGYGNLIEIDHGNGFKTFYGHCKSVLVKEGQRVNRGEKIGEVGSTGRSTGPHLHFEVRVGDIPQNPIKYLK